MRSSKLPIRSGVRRTALQPTYATTTATQTAPIAGSVAGGFVRAESAAAGWYCYACRVSNRKPSQKVMPLKATMVAISAAPSPQLE